MTPPAITPPARLLAIMGSGETTPTMVKTHRQLFEQLGPPPVPAVLLDTPYGFQTNAPDISAKSVAYFRDSVGRPVSVAPLSRTEGADLVGLEAALAMVAQAGWVFAGPGSPTYALWQWRPTALPALLAEKLARGGCVVFASAAALTLGRWSVPVYEVYKVGADPVWEEGLDLLGRFGLSVAVIPHYDNAEGGTHDTRYCYLGETRLRALESQLPSEGWVLGVDEHTACIFDFAAGTASVSGLGTVTVRHAGSSVVVPSGKTVGVDELIGMAERAQVRAVSGGSGRGGAEADVDLAGSSAAASPASTLSRGSTASGDGPAISPLMAEVHRLNDVFSDALGRRDAPRATAAVLELEGTLHDWAADTFQSDELDRARAALRAMIVRLGEVAGPGLRDPHDVVGPWVEALLFERAEARAGRRFDDADRIRRELVSQGVEVRDAPEGTRWLLLPHDDE
jgi:hypothetical protein